MNTRTVVEHIFVIGLLGCAPSLGATIYTFETEEAEASSVSSGLVESYPVQNNLEEGRPISILAPQAPLFFSQAHVAKSIVVGRNLVSGDDFSSFDKQAHDFALLEKLIRERRAKEQATDKANKRNSSQHPSIAEQDWRRLTGETKAAELKKEESPQDLEKTIVAIATKHGAEDEFMSIMNKIQSSLAQQEAAALLVAGKGLAKQNTTLALDVDVDSMSYIGRGLGQLPGSSSQPKQVLESGMASLVRTDYLNQQLSADTETPSVHMQPEDITEFQTVERPEHVNTYSLENQPRKHAPITKSHKSPYQGRSTMFGDTVEMIKVILYVITNPLFIFCFIAFLLSARVIHLGRPSS